MMTKIKAVLWDMDGTLVDSEAISVDALSTALAELGIAAPHDLYEAVVGRSADAIYAWLASEHGLEMDFLAWEERKHHYYMTLAWRLAAFEAAIDTWRALEARGISQAVVSNSDRAIVDINLRNVGLTKPGLISVSRNDLRRGKPDPEGYLRAAWLLGAKPDECIIVEDSFAGASAGIASGITTVFVPHATVPAPTGVTSLGQMADLLEKIA
jgi:HAD superfamily hydrolase (TIGR01509 family)